MMRRLLTLTSSEAAFFSAAADTMIPADALTPSGSDCGVTIFIEPTTRRCVGRRRQDVPLGTVPAGQTGAGLSVAAHAARVFRRWRRRH